MLAKISIISFSIFICALLVILSALTKSWRIGEDTKDGSVCYGLRKFCVGSKCEGYSDLATDRKLMIAYSFIVMSLLPLLGMALHSVLVLMITRSTLFFKMEVYAVCQGLAVVLQTTGLIIFSKKAGHLGVCYGYSFFLAVCSVTIGVISTVFAAVIRSRNKVTSG